MKKSLSILFLSLFLMAPTNAMGLFYTDATYPVTATGVTNKEITSLKKGEASTINVLFFVEVGDASIDTIARNAGISKISHIDVNEQTVLFFFRKLTVKVYGS